MALISKGAQLIWNKNLSFTSFGSGKDNLTATNSPIDELMGENFVFPGLQEIGSITMNGSAGAYDQIEVTTLADAKHVYVDGLMSDNSSTNEITCKFLYNPYLFRAFNNIRAREESVANGYASNENMKAYDFYVIDIPNGGHFKITASISSITMDTVSTNNALTFTVTFNVKQIIMSDTQYSVTTVSE